MSVPHRDPSSSLLLAVALHLRAATGADAPALARLWRDAWQSANPGAHSVAPLAHWQARVAAEFGAPCTTLVGEHAGCIVAFLVLDGAQRHLHQLFVDPAVQGQGLGAALVQVISRDWCPTGWTLHVATTNGAARRFYARCGLVEEGVDRHPDTGRERALCRWRPAQEPQ